MLILPAKGKVYPVNEQLLPCHPERSRGNYYISTPQASPSHLAPNLQVRGQPKTKSSDNQIIAFKDKVFVLWLIENIAVYIYD